MLVKHTNNYLSLKYRKQRCKFCRLLQHKILEKILASIKFINKTNNQNQSSKRISICSDQSVLPLSLNNIQQIVKNMKLKQNSSKYNEDQHINWFSQFSCTIRILCDV